MHRWTSLLWTALLIATVGSAYAQQPPFATARVEGTDNVYIYRYGFHQSMFVVTSAGVIATDPIGLGRPQAVTTYIDEIRKVTKAPIRYVVYSHHHWDHIAGGKPFKDLGAVFVAHRNAKARLEAIPNPDVVMPTQWLDKQFNLKLGTTTLELTYVGRNHSDNSLVMRLPKEKIIFVVDWLPINGIQFRGMADTWPLELQDSIKKVLAMDWDRLIPGHPGPGGRLGTKDDVRAHLAYLEELSAATKKAAEEGKCYDTAIKEIQLPKYESWPNYKAFLAGNIERYCDVWRRGI
jgi:glyoxylase-like metal-dependent hydrolase (beta-lactamase superfamily II)